MSRTSMLSRTMSRTMGLVLIATLQSGLAQAQTAAVNTPTGAAPVIPLAPTPAPTDVLPPPADSLPAATSPDTSVTAPAPVQQAAPSADTPVPMSLPSSPMASGKDAVKAAKSANAAEVARISGLLNSLQTDPRLATRVPPQSLNNARTAVAAADRSQNDAVNGAYLLYMADRKVQLARAQAETAYAQEQYQQLSAQSGRTPGAAIGVGTAGSSIAPAIIDTPQQEELQKRAVAMHPVRDRGALRFTVSEVSVMPGTITLTRDMSDGLVALSVYLRRNPQSQLLLIGHSRGTPGDDAIQRTAQSRADGVRNYLMRLGVQVEQITLDTKVSPDDSQCARCVDAFLDPPWATQSPE